MENCTSLAVNPVKKRGGRCGVWMGIPRRGAMAMQDCSDAAGRGRVHGGELSDMCSVTEEEPGPRSAHLHGLSKAS